MTSGYLWWFWCSPSWEPPLGSCELLKFKLLRLAFNTLCILTPIYFSLIVFNCSFVQTHHSNQMTHYYSKQALRSAKMAPSFRMISPLSLPPPSSRPLYPLCPSLSESCQTSEAHLKPHPPYVSFFDLHFSLSLQNSYIPSLLISDFP